MDTVRTDSDSTKVSPPLSASLLTTGVDRQAFAQWLDMVRRYRGMSKKALGRAIKDYDSAYAVNKWLTGEVFPRREMLERIAGALAVSRAVVYMRAGYPQLLLKALPRLLELGLLQMHRQSVVFDPHWLGVFSDDLPDDGLGYRLLNVLDEKYAWVPLAIPLPIYDAMLFAIGSFARRGDYYSQHDIAYDSHAINRMGDILDDVRFDFSNPNRLPSALSVAVEILDNTQLDRDLRM